MSRTRRALHPTQAMRGQWWYSLRTIDTNNIRNKHITSVVLFIELNENTKSANELIKLYKLDNMHDQFKNKIKYVREYCQWAIKFLLLKYKCKYGRTYWLISTWLPSEERIFSALKKDIYSAINASSHEEKYSLRYFKSIFLWRKIWSKTIISTLFKTSGKVVLKSLENSKLLYLSGWADQF